MTGPSDAPFIPFALPDVGDAEVAAVAEAIRSGWVTSGPVMHAFESEFADYVGGDVQAIALNSGTAGLHLVLEAVGIGPGDEVIVPTWTFTATAEVVRYLGARPVIVDIDAETLNISADAVARAVTAKTKAVIPVHFGGLPVDLSRLRHALGREDIKIIEDAAHTLPATGETGVVGGCQGSDAAVFSFYATKPITTGEGGMVTTRDTQLADRCRVMRLHGIDRNAFDRYASSKPTWFYDVVAPGFKYNMTDMAAAMGRVQLERADQMQARRETIAEHYLREFADLPLVLPARAPQGQVHSWHLFVIRLDSSGPAQRDDFISAMSEAGIGTSVHFIPLHEHTYWRGFVANPAEMLPNAVKASPVAVSLPIFSKMTDGEVERVVNSVRTILSASKARSH